MSGATFVPSNLFRHCPFHSVSFHQHITSHRRRLYFCSRKGNNIQTFWCQVKTCILTELCRKVSCRQFWKRMNSKVLRITCPKARRRGKRSWQVAANSNFTFWQIPVWLSSRSTLMGFKQRATVARLSLILSLKALQARAILWNLWPPRLYVVLTGSWCRRSRVIWTMSSITASGQLRMFHKRARKMPHR